MGAAAGSHVDTNRTDLAGSKLPDGVYTLRVTATDPKGGKIATTTYVQGPVTAVEQSNGKTLITVNGTQVSWDAVSTITQAATAAAGTTSGTTSSTTQTPQAGA